MSMTKKHYEGLAAALKASAASASVIEAVAKFCARDNMAFKPARFKAAATDNSPLAVKARELAQAYNEEGELEIDDEGAPVSLHGAHPEGAYVAMWRWVSFEEAA